MKKISLKDVRNGLKRDEMRVIIGGSGSCNQGFCYQPVPGGSIMVGYCHTPAEIYNCTTSNPH
jgi:hypothetical protein